MQSILRKTLLASALAAAFTANAGTVSPQPGLTDGDGDPRLPVISQEGLDLVGGITIGNSVDANDGDEIFALYTITTNYSGVDLLELRITGATIQNTSASGISLVREAGAENSTFEAIGVNAETGTITFRPVNSSTGVIFDTAMNSTNNGFRLDGVVLDALDSTVSLGGAGITVQGNEFDATAATAIASVASTVSVSVVTDEAFDGEIDVTENRLQFTNGEESGGDGVLEDSVDLSVGSVADLLNPTLNTAVFTVTGTGSNAFLLDEDGDLSSDAFDLSTSGTGILDDDANFVATFGTPGSNTITFIAPGNTDANAGLPALEAQTFSAAAEINYELDFGLAGFDGASNPPATDDTLETTLALGAWQLSAATVNIPFMPFGAGITQIMHISNDGMVSGDISLTAFDDEGQSYGPVTLPIAAAAGSVTRINGAVISALADAGFDGAGNLDITLSVNSPEGDIEVFAAYNVRGDRIAAIVEQAGTNQ